MDAKKLPTGVSVAGMFKINIPNRILNSCCEIIFCLIIKVTFYYFNKRHLGAFLHFESIEP